ncbi:MAG: FmdB family transcriptional regulator [Actinobacteria bacterium]|nr:FmdB family transcriptional regulator [Actinomycetota bacterium]
MPVYEYRCKNCAHQFDIQQSFSDDSLTVCPECGQAELRKVFQPVGITFKGSGFYKNDSRDGSSGAGSSSAASSGSGSSSSGSSESSSSESNSSSTGTSEKSSSSTGASENSSSTSSTDKPAAATPSKPAAKD